MKNIIVNFNFEPLKVVIAFRGFFISHPTLTGIVLVRLSCFNQTFSRFVNILLMILNCLVTV